MAIALATNTKKIKHKVLMLVLRCLKGESPTYLLVLLILHNNG